PAGCHPEFAPPPMPIGSNACCAPSSPATDSAVARPDPSPCPTALPALRMSPRRLAHMLEKSVPYVTDGRQGEMRLTAGTRGGTHPISLLEGTADPGIDGRTVSERHDNARMAVHDDVTHEPNIGGDHGHATQPGLDEHRRKPLGPTREHHDVRCVEDRARI